MSDVVILSSFFIIELWLLVLTLYVIRRTSQYARSLGPIGEPGVSGPPGPPGPMGMAGRDADPQIIEALSMRLSAVERLLVPHSPDKGSTSSTDWHAAHDWDKWPNNLGYKPKKLSDPEDEED